MGASGRFGSTFFMVAPPPLPSSPLVRVHDLHRQFENVHAVKGVSFDIHAGQVVGFIGANGAGKTTTMRMMATLDIPSAGRIEIGGQDAVQRPAQVRQQVGWMPDNFGTYGSMTVFEYLDFFARAYGLRGKARTARVQEVMEFADLLPLADRLMNTLSKGMGQRLCFGRMLIPDPDFLILDEPAAGLDPKARLEFKNLVRLLAQRRKTLFISSHILSELGEMCDTLLFIDQGKIVYHGGAEALRRGSSMERTVVNIRILGEPAALAEWAQSHPGWAVVETRRDGALLAVDSGEPERLAEALRQMVQAGIRIVEFRQEQRRLEDAFVEILKAQS